MDVQLQSVGASRQAAIEGGNRVFRPDFAAAFMRKHERPRRFKSGVHQNSRWSTVEGQESRVPVVESNFKHSFSGLLHDTSVKNQNDWRSAPRARGGPRCVSAAPGEKR